jgi:hypothetical protein
MAFLLVGRIAGLTDPEIYQAWKSRKRDEVIELALRTSRDARPHSFLWQSDNGSCRSMICGHLGVISALSAMYPFHGSGTFSS